MWVLAATAFGVSPAIPFTGPVQRGREHELDPQSRESRRIPVPAPLSGPSPPHLYSQQTVRAWQRDRDACTNIFDALESVAKIKYNRPNDTFGQVKNHIEQNNLLRAEIIAMFRALSQLRNQNFGHGMAVNFSLTSAEVDFTYLTCIGAILLLTRAP